MERLSEAIENLGALEEEASGDSKASSDAASMHWRERLAWVSRQRKAFAFSLLVVRTAHYHNEFKVCLSSSSLLNPK
jgi:hypothetical protein